MKRFLVSSGLIFLAACSPGNYDSREGSISSELLLQPNFNCGAQYTAYEAEVAADDAVHQELAPTGRLRVGINRGNVINIGTNKLCTAASPCAGVAVDLSCQLATRLGVPLDFVTYADNPSLAAANVAGQHDVSFTFDPVVGVPTGLMGVHHHLNIALAFVVSKAKPWALTADVPLDATIAVAKGTSGFFILTDAGYTHVIQVASGPAALAGVKSGLYDVAAVGRSIGEPFAANAANNAKIFADNYGYGNAAMTVQLGKYIGTHYLDVYVEWAKKKGFIQAAINATQPPLIGVLVPALEQVGGVYPADHDNGNGRGGAEGGNNDDNRGLDSD